MREFWLQRGVPASPMQNAGYFHHVLSWWTHRHDANVLWVFYEDLQADLAAEVARIAAFMGSPAAHVPAAVAHSTLPL